MFSVASRGSSDDTIDRLLKEALAELDGPPSFILCGASVSVDVSALQSSLDGLWIFLAPAPSIPNSE